MTTLDPADLVAALTELSDDERTALTARAISVAVHFADVKMPRVAAVFHSLGVLAAEEGDRRAALFEHARRELELDGDTGALLTDPGALDPTGIGAGRPPGASGAWAQTGDRPGSMGRGVPSLSVWSLRPA